MADINVDIDTVAVVSIIIALFADKKDLEVIKSITCVRLSFSE